MDDLNDYWDMLNTHDWYWRFSDDNRWYNAGNFQENKLRAIAEKSLAHKVMFERFSNHYWTGKPWNTEQTPKPERPEPRTSRKLQDGDF